MGIRCTIFHSRELVVAEARGPIVLQDVEAYLDEVVVSAAMPYRKLFDALEAIPCLSDTDTMMVGARISAYAAFDPRGPLAFVVDDKFRWQAFRVLNLGGAKRPARIFKTIVRAREWLDAQPPIQGPAPVTSTSQAPTRTNGPTYDDTGAAPAVHSKIQLVEGDLRWPRLSLNLSSPGRNHFGRQLGHRNRR